MSAAASIFRGYHGIKDILDMMRPMIDWLLANKPEPRHLTLHRKDYDLIHRWPKAGAMHGFEYSAEGIVTYKGIVIGFDKRPGRYQSTSDGEQR